MTNWYFFTAVSLITAGCSRPAEPPQTGVRQEEVQFSGIGAKLSGTLFLPAKSGKHPAVVLFHGSGPEPRNSGRANWFAAHGVAALTYDKRGVGQSTGDFRKVPFPSLVEDGLAAIAFLKVRNDIDAKRIGVWGQSQGGWLGPLAASRSSDVAFVIAVSGPGVTPGEQMIFYFANQLREQGYSEAQVAQASALRRQVWSYLASGNGYAAAKSAMDRAKAEPWYESLRGQSDHLMSSFAHADTSRGEDWFTSEMNYDPLATLRKLKAPALFLFGSDDQLVPVPKSVELIRQTLTAAGHHDFTIHVFPGADHALYAPDDNGGMRLAPGYEEIMQEWLSKRLALPAS